MKSSKQTAQAYIIKDAFVVIIAIIMTYVTKNWLSDIVTNWIFHLTGVQINALVAVPSWQLLLTLLQFCNSFSFSCFNLLRSLHSGL